MSTIHFVGGEKGGVGKSVLARLLSQYCLDHNINYQALDADQSHATLSRYYQDFTRPLILEDFESSDQIIELAIEQDRNIVIDLPAQSQRFLDKWMTDNEVLDLCKETQINIVFWYVVDDGRDSLDLLDNFLDQYAKQLNCVVVKNLGRGKNFSDVENLLEAKSLDGLQQITLPALHATTFRKIEKLNFSYWAAINLKDFGGPGLSLMERQRTKVWLKKSYVLFDGVFSEIKKVETAIAEETVE